MFVQDTDIIYNEGEFSEEIYFIVKGNVKMLLDN